MVARVPPRPAPARHHDAAPLGFRGLQEAARQPETREILILMVTALNEPADFERGVQAGTDDFLTKPVNKVELLCRIRSLLRVRHLKSQLDRTLAYLAEVESSSRVERPSPSEHRPGRPVLARSESTCTMATSLPRVVIKPRRARPFFARHPWVFVNSIDRVEGDPEPGDEVRVSATKGSSSPAGCSTTGARSGSASTAGPTSRSTTRSSPAARPGPCAPDRCAAAGRDRARPAASSSAKGTGSRV